MISNAQGPAVVLAQMNDSYIEKTFHWISDVELRRMFLMRGEVSWKGHQDYMRRTMADPKQRIYVILNHGTHVGNCGFKNIEGNEAELWIYIGSETIRGRGVGKAATKLLIEQGVNELALRKIYLHVAEFNHVARSMYKDLGFEEIEAVPEEEWSNRGVCIVRMELRA